jgi:hypothetical protein
VNPKSAAKDTADHAVLVYVFCYTYLYIAHGVVSQLVSRDTVPAAGGTDWRTSDYPRHTPAFFASLPSDMFGNEGHILDRSAMKTFHQSLCLFCCIL